MSGVAASRCLLEPHFGDMAQWMDVGDRMLRGQVPYRDFFSLYGPLLYAWCAAWYRLTGADWFAAKLQLEAISPAVSLAAAYVVATRSLRLRQTQALFLAVVFAAGLDRFFWAPALRVWVPLASFACARMAAREGDLAGYRRAALAAGASLLISVEAGCAAVLACGILVLGRRQDEDVTGGDWRKSYLWWLIPVGLYGAAFPGAAGGYLKTCLLLARYTNWYGGLAFPAAPVFSLQAAFLFGPFALVAAAGARAVAALLRGGLGRPARRREEDLFDLALAVFGAVLLRSLLGRSDQNRVVFCLAPALLAGLRLCERAEDWRALAPLAWGLALAAPFVAMSAVGAEGELSHLRLVYRHVAHPDSGDVPWPEEGLRAPQSLVPRFRRIAAEVDALVPPGEPVLSLPMSLYAHLARRPSALPVAHPEYAFLLDGASTIASRLESSGVSVAVLDSSLRMVAPGIDGLLAAGGGDPLSWRLTWSTEADEAITRDLRAYLRAHFRRDRAVDGAVFFLRRAKPAALPPDRVVEVVDRPQELIPGRSYRFDLAHRRAGEIRVALSCRYRPGLASLAKTYLDVAYLDDRGRWTTGLIPVPPEELDRDVRFPVAPVALKALVLRIDSPGLFNPAPAAVLLRGVALASGPGGR